MIFGVDCADTESNTNTDWARAKAEGPINFAILRATYGASPDVCFATSWPRIAAIGIPRGAYMFLRFVATGASPEDQANAFAETVGTLAATDLPPVVDLEFPGNGIADTGMSPAQALAWTKRAIATLSARYGVSPMIYTSGRVWAEDLGNIAAPDLVDCPLWLARYYWPEHTTAARDAGGFAGGHRDPKVPPPWGDADNWWIHQYQGDAYSLPGFTSTVDMNRFNTLVRGDSGDRVRWVQRRLGMEQTGDFDDALNARVVKLQTDSGLVADGIVGPRTFAALCWNKPGA